MYIQQRHQLRKSVLLLIHVLYLYKSTETQVQRLPLDHRDSVTWHNVGEKGLLISDCYFRILSLN